MMISAVFDAPSSSFAFSRTSRCSTATRPISEAAAARPASGMRPISTLPAMSILRTSMPTTRQRISARLAELSLTLYDWLIGGCSSQNLSRLEQFWSAGKRCSGSCQSCGSDLIEFPLLTSVTSQNAHNSNASLTDTVSRIRRSCPTTVEMCRIIQPYADSLITAETIASTNRLQDVKRQIKT